MCRVLTFAFLLQAVNLIYLGKYCSAMLNITDCGEQLLWFYQLDVPAVWGLYQGFAVPRCSSGLGTVVTNDWRINVFP